MKIPKTFLPEKDLEGKVNELSKEDYKKNVPNSFNPPNLEELKERTRPIFEDCLKTIYGERRYHFINLEGVPNPYQGWIDFTITNNYEAKMYYCTLFDLQSEDGKVLRKRFVNSQREYHIYHFKPNDTFEVKGSLIKKGYTNGFKWYILRTDEKRN